jgi:hypothetical protein
MPNPVASPQYLDHELTLYDQTFYETEYPEYWAANGRHHSADGSLPLGLRRIVSSRIDWLGEAVTYDGSSTDIPLTDFGIETDQYKVLVKITSAQWNMFDLASEDFASQNAVLPLRDLVETKMQACRESIDQSIHQQVVAGSPGFQGLFSLRDVEVITITDDLYAMTADEIYEWFKDFQITFSRRTKLTASLTKALIPVELNRVLFKRFVSNTDGNPFRLLTDSSQEMLYGSIESVNELESAYLESSKVHAAGYNHDRMLLGAIDDSRVLRRRYYPLNRTQAHPIDGLNWRVFSFCATGEVEARQPHKLVYVDFPKAA